MNRRALTAMVPLALFALVTTAGCTPPAEDAATERAATLADGEAGGSDAAVAPGGGAEYGDMGTVRFDPECSEAAAEHARRGLGLLHHMTYLDADRSFAAAVEADPSCTIGYWGQAMAIIHPLWPDVPDAEDLARGWRLVERAHAQTVPEGRPTAYLSTVEAYFRDAATRDESERLRDFESAWRRVHETYPGDLEARALYALSHVATASPSDKTYRHQREALALLEEVLAEIPDHPGAHHYVIHARDVPALAEEGLEIARAYGRLAPAVPHALHMPTHIYTRVGSWEESIEGNERSAEASWARNETAGGITTDFHHALDYLAYAHLQRAEDRQARAVMERALAADGPWAAVNMPAIAYALAAIPARFAVERRDWEGAQAVAPREPEGFPWDDRFAPFEALTYFARGLGGARGGAPSVATAALDSLEAVRGRVSETASNAYWSNQIEVQALAVRAWLTFAAGNRGEGLELMRRAAELEASTEKHAVTPGELVPAAELLGEMLLEAGQPEEALAAFRTALDRSPARLNGLAGAARAARATGREDLAARYYGQLLELTASAEVERPAMAEARAFMGDAM